VHREVFVIRDGSIALDEIDSENRRLANNRQEFGFQIFQSPRQLACPNNRGTCAQYAMASGFSGNAGVISETRA
jgi:hypothetical protein